MIDDFERCYRAVQGKDARFDGWFVTAVTSTGIYCRPSCPAITPKRANVRFHPTAAAAQLAGFRACKRCRPDAAPGSPEWNVRADVVGRAMRLIADGVVDRDGVQGLATRLGYSERHLHRLLRAEVGAGPLALARAQRAQTARVLVETTELPFSQVAFGAGFASIRQFNDTVREVFAATPTELRQAARRRGGTRTAAGPSSAPPAWWRCGSPSASPSTATRCSTFLGRRAVPGIEERAGDAYRRTLRLPRGHAVVELAPRPDHVACRIRLTDLRDLAQAVQRSRRLLDLDADPVAVGAVLGARPAAGPAGGEGAGPALARARRRGRAGAAGRAGPAGLAGRGPHPHRPAGRRGRHAAAGTRRRADPPLPRSRPRWPSWTTPSWPCPTGGGDGARARRRAWPTAPS